MQQKLLTFDGLGTNCVNYGLPIRFSKLTTLPSLSHEGLGNLKNCSRIFPESRAEYLIIIKYKSWGKVTVVMIESWVDGPHVGCCIGWEGARGRGEIHLNRGAVGLYSKSSEKKSVGKPCLLALNVRVYLSPLHIYYEERI